MTGQARNSQRLVRLVGVIGFFACAALGPLLYVFAEPSKTRASTPVPEWDFEAFRSGKLAKLWEVHLEESSPLTVALRSWHNDQMFELGGLRSKDAFMGRSEWVFFGSPRDQHTARLQRYAEQRQRFYRQLKAACDQLGVHLLCAVVPDKATVYPDFAFLDGLPRPVRESMYPLVNKEIADAGIERLDLLARFKALRLQSPEVILYLPRDTHWDWPGSRAAAELCVDRLLELGWDLGQRELYVPYPIVRVPVSPDLLEVYGLLPGGRVSPILSDGLRYAYLARPGPGGRSTPAEEDPKGARLALCGDSFGSALRVSLRGYSGRLVDTLGVIPGEGPFPGLIETLTRIRKGEIDVGVIVWVCIERSFAEGMWWKNPPDPSGG